MKTIQEAYKFAKAAFNLANEWRDTLSYSTVGILCARAAMQGHAFEAAIFGLGFASGRELLRHFSWCFLAEPRLAGGLSNSSVDKKKNFLAAGIVTCGFLDCLFSSLIALSASSARLPEMPPLNVTAASASTVIVIATGMAITDYYGLQRRGASWHDFYNLYFGKETGMWDWPRKENKSGPTQTQKFMDGFRAFDELLTSWMPPAMEPVQSFCKALPAATPQV